MKNAGFELSSREIVALYLHLNDGSKELDSVMENLLKRISERLYDNLSIDELEKLSELYSRNIDVLKQNQ